MSITTGEELLGREPRTVGTRIAVRHVAGKVINGGRSPAYVADQLDTSLASVYEALAYYDDNAEELRRLERENAEAFDRVRETSLKPPEPTS